MGHGHIALIAGDAWMTGVIILVFVIVIAGVIWLIHRKRVASDGLTPIERKELEYPNREILAMLRQHGGPMTQREVIDSLPGDLEDIARVMQAMESKGLIQRKWRSDLETYIVTA
ncbi:hypothetical protein [uncultured Desulfosarcina sp.]|uniref:hypothetical protein n=1 Tax=uncultured Desulfosarcina sp. TaxID=218289 RepID=UPI0029C683AB|nr:hypothetical protein [uncultured Desulfosarcina sp.]